MSRPQPHEKTVDERDPRDVRRLVVIVLTASAALWVASVWDISWQTTFESGTFWSPPHVVSLLLAGAVYAVAHPWTAWPPAPRAGISRPVVTGCRLIAIGALVMLGGGAVDLWWHASHPPSLHVLTPTHLALVTGVLIVWVGGLLVALSAQDLPREGVRTAKPVAHLVSAALVVYWVVLMATEYVGRPNLWHGSEFYWVSGGLFPIVLLAIARSSHRHWAASITTFVYAIGMMIAIWILQLVPVVTPSVNQEVVHFVPPPFPLLLVLPSLAIDALVRRAGSSHRPGTDHILAVAGGVAFMGIFVVIHWFLGDFLLSPAGRGFVMGADHWPHHAVLGEWRYQYWTQEPGRRALAVGMAAAGATAIVSARAGLWLGDRLSTLTLVQFDAPPKKTRQ